jgi:hypothetical protein
VTPRLRLGLAGIVSHGESVEQVLAARIRPPDSCGRIVLPAAALIPLVRGVSRARQRRKASRLTDQTGFPLASRMMLVLTDRRLLVFCPGGRNGHDLGGLLGSVARGDIIAAHRPSLGGAWRTVRLELASGETVSMQIVGSGAERFAAAFTPGVPEQVSG